MMLEKKNGLRRVAVVALTLDQNLKVRVKVKLTPAREELRAVCISIKNKERLQSFVLMMDHEEKNKKAPTWNF